jgi:hypothetical protein
MLLHANEDIARWRWARKILRLPASAASAEAEVWLCVCSYPGGREPLEVHVNGRLAGRLKPESDTAGAWAWRKVRLPAGALRGGANEFILASDNLAMNGWMLGIENGQAAPASFLSTDRGATWRNERMGTHGALRGEYLVRVRSHGKQRTSSSLPPPPPPIVYENLAHPRRRELCGLVPARVRSVRIPWVQVLALRTWVAQAWTYEAFGRSYAPWDPATVLAWTNRNWGHGGPRPIAMCVHYGMSFVSLAAALGHRSRGLAITESINGPNGHFMTEIWDDARGKWVAHDPNFDLHYEDERGTPLSGVELADRARAGQSRAADMRRGPGFTSACPRLNGLLNGKLATGEAFALAGVWRLNDVIAEPAGAPPNHGSVVYCETDFVWYAPGGDLAGTEMFPHHATDRPYFDAPPPPPPQQRKHAAHGAARKGGRR